MKHEKIKILKKRLNILGEKNPHAASLLDKLAYEYKKIKDLDNASKVIMKELELYKKTDKEKTIEYVLALNNLAAANKELEYYTESLSLYDQALKILPKLSTPHNLDYALIQNNMGAVYSKLERYSDAKSCYEKAIEIYRHEKNLEEYVLCIFNLAWINFNDQNYDSGKKLFEEVLTYENKIGKQHDLIADCHYALAEYYRYFGMTKEAHEQIKQSLEIYSESCGKSSPEYATSLNKLAGIIHKEGNFSQAEEFYLESLQIIEKILGKDNDTYASFLFNLILNYACTEKFDQAADKINVYIDIENKLIPKIFTNTTEKSRIGFIQRIRFHYDLFLSILLTCNSQNKYSQYISNLIIQRKGLEFDYSVIEKHHLTKKYPNFCSDFYDLDLMYKQVSSKDITLQNQGNNDNINLINNEIISREEYLDKKIPEIRMEKSIASSTTYDILNALPQDSILIEFFRFRFFQPDTFYRIGKKTFYLPIILGSNAKSSIEIGNLIEAEKLESMISSFRKTITSILDAKDESELKLLESSSMKEIRSGIGMSLRQKIIPDKLLEKIQDYKHLFLSLDGQISKLPFEVLPIDNNLFLIDKYDISYLTSSKDILRFSKDLDNTSSEPIVVANPDFDSYNIVVDDSISKNRNEANYSLYEKLPHVDKLDGTECEGITIAELLDVKPWLREQATKINLLNISSPVILHIATHCFFLESHQNIVHEYPGASVLLENKINREKLDKSFDPFLLSGLILSGFNIFLDNKKSDTTIQNSILTAKDVCKIDLSGTKLVVLSACDTGSGEIKNGEGVYGLQRAFLLTGSKSIISSLWKIGDDSTVKLMTIFYENLKSGKSYYGSFRRSQLNLKNSKTYSHPFYWSGFVYHGNPDIIGLK